VARRNTGSIALVLAGGGARGAYEAGALSVLLPLLEERGERPRILVGTSAGAVNASFLAANADVPPAQLIPASLALWESLNWGEVVKALISAASLRRVGGYAGEVLGRPGARITSLLDFAPLRRTVRQHVDFARVAENVGAGVLDAVAVVATSALTGRSVVFHDGLASPRTTICGALTTWPPRCTRSTFWPRRRSRPCSRPSGCPSRAPPGAGISTAARV
jgi:NTE family protein